MKSVASRVSSSLTKIEELCLAWGILGIAGLSIANVLSRTLFSESLAFAEEGSQILVVFVTFLGLGYATGKGRHIRMTALYDQLPLVWRKRMTIAISASTAALLFFFAYLAMRYAFGTVRELGSRSPVLGVPLYLVYLAAPLGLSLAGVQYVLAVVKNLRTEGVWLSYETQEDHDVPPEGI